MRRSLVVLVLAAGLTGCGSASTTSESSSASAPPAVTSSSASTTRSAAVVKHTSAPHARRRPAAHPSGGLAVSSASAEVVQPQPAPGTCHSSGQGLYALPDPQCTPGALNPAVTQATIGATICVSGYTKTVRPAESITETEKQGSMAAYGDGGSMSGYEYDHLVSLELGGAANDPRNLWPEPGASPNPKDAVENTLHDLVCSGQIPLAQAQHIVATNWVAYARAHEAAPAPAPAAAPAPALPAAGSGPHCTVSASYSSRYRDWNVYVDSNQPEATATVSDASGHSDGWHTSASGYADVYFKAPAGAAGETVTVHVGGATCQTTL